MEYSNIIVQTPAPTEEMVANLQKQERDTAQYSKGIALSKAINVLKEKRYGTVLEPVRFPNLPSYRVLHYYFNERYDIPASRMSPSPLDDGPSYGNYSPASPYYPPHPNDNLESPESPPWTYCDAIEVEYPEPYPTSGQYRGQTRYDFFAERHAGNETEERAETQGQKDARTRRREAAEQHNQLGNRPKKFKARILKWDPSSHPGIMLRTPLDQDDIDIYWNDFYPPQRIYDDFHNEWDLCSHIEVDKSTLSKEVLQFYDSLDDDDEPILDRMEDLGIQACTVEERQGQEDGSIPQVTKDAIVEDQRVYWKSRLFPSQPLPLFHSMDPKNYAIHRFGLQISGGPIQQSTRLNWIATFGMKIPGVDNQNLDGDMAIREFVDIITEAGRRSDPLNYSTLQRLHGKLDIHPNVNSLLTASPIRIRRVNAEDANERFYLYFFYFEDEQFENRDWTLAVRSAANAVLAIRERWGTTRDNIVFNFLRYGIHFHTLQKNGKPITAKFVLPDLHTTPHAKPSQKYDLDDYYQYQIRREIFFDSPLGGVAGRSGGIFARLWREDTSKFDQRMKRIMAGPTFYSLLGGYVVNCGLHGTFSDNQITHGMAKVIIGMYESQDR